MRVFGCEVFEFNRFEFVVYDARALPQQHVCAGLLLDVGTEVAIGRPDDFFALFFQVRDDFQCDGGGDHPVGACFDFGGGIGVHDYGAVGMRVAERGEFVNRAAQIKRAFGA